MQESPMLDLCDSGQPLPLPQPGDCDATSLLLELVQTAKGADDLAKALKDRSIRDILKQRGVQIHAADDVGYNSLPLELRDQIRGYLIADLKRDKAIRPLRKCCPSFSNYACIDSEWRAAIESITFRSIRLRTYAQELDQDLDLFARYVVGNRRHYLQRVRLPCTTVRQILNQGHHSQLKADISTNLLLQLFSCMGQWHEVSTWNGNFHLEVDSLSSHCAGQPSIYTNDTLNEIRGLPMAPYVTNFYYFGGCHLHIEEFLALLSRLPRLQHMSIGYSDLDFRRWDNEHGEYDYPSLWQLFFDTLSETVPTLKGMEFSTDIDYADSPTLEFRKACMTYSQQLYDVSLVDDPSREEVLDFFYPFRSENFDPHAPPRVSWPKLTRFKVEPVQGYDTASPVESMTELMLIVGRAVRYMPLIQNLELGMTYWHTGDANLIYLTLKVYWDDSLNRSRAKLLISHEDFYPEWNVAQAVASEEAKELWRESLLKGANAVLEIHVECESDMD